MKVFVSYSHEDTDIVVPLVRLIRRIEPDVFRDADTIPLGSRWLKVIDEALGNADLVLLFWCKHAADSEQVGDEYRVALARGKDVLPIRLDDLALPALLRGFQSLDLRALELPGHGSMGAMGGPGGPLSMDEAVSKIESAIGRASTGLRN